MLQKLKRRQVSLWIALFLAGCSSSVNLSGGNRSTASDLPETLRLAVTDVFGLEELEAEYEPFRAALAAALGTAVEFVPIENVGAATIALQQGNIDLALAGPSEYVQIRARTNATPILSITRPGYYSVIAVPEPSNTKTLADLKGQSIALSDIGSTSGHLGPLYLLIQAGLQPGDDIDDIKVQMLGDDGSVAAAKSGEVTAWGGSATDFNELLQSEAQPFRIVAQGEPLPSDIIVGSSSITPEQIVIIQEKMLAAQAEIVAGIAVHQSKYKESSFKTAQDSDYDLIRRVYAAIGEGEFAP